MEFSFFHIFELTVIFIIEKSSILPYFSWCLFTIGRKECIYIYIYIYIWLNKTDTLCLTTLFLIYWSLCMSHRQPIYVYTKTWTDQRYIYIYYIYFLPLLFFLYWLVDSKTTLSPYIYIYIYIYIMRLCWKYGVPWLSLAIHPYHSSLLGVLLDCIQCLLNADVYVFADMFMCRGSQESFTCEFVPVSLVVPSTICSSYLNGLWWQMNCRTAAVLCSVLV